LRFEEFEENNRTVYEKFAVKSTSNKKKDLYKKEDN